jgi:hypothetical protein
MPARRIEFQPMKIYSGLGSFMPAREDIFRPNLVV